MFPDPDITKKERGKGGGNHIFVVTEEPTEYLGRIREETETSWKS